VTLCALPTRSPTQGYYLWLERTGIRDTEGTREAWTTSPPEHEVRYLENFIARQDRGEFELPPRRPRHSLRARA
jgi:hypothetical protein